MKKIYLKLEKQPETIAELLFKLFSYDYDGYLKSVETFSDEQCKIKECNENKFRSIDDVLIIVNTYFPQTSIKEVMQNLLSIVIRYNNELFTICTLHCTDINKPTIYFSKCYDLDDFAFTYYEDEDSMYLSEFEDWAELFKIVNFNSKNELLDFKNKQLKQIKNNDLTGINLFKFK